MMIHSFDKLVANGLSPKARAARAIALELLQSGLRAADPKEAITKHVLLKESSLRIDGLKIDLSRFSQIIVVGAGKATAAMSEALEAVLRERITHGWINVPYSIADRTRLNRIVVNGAGHPIPDESGLRGAEEILRMADSLGKDDLLICLISGGGSSLMPLPRPGLELEDKQQTNDMLIKSGARINEINVVRKHLSSIKGGQLAKAAYPATVLNLVLSDVVGDPLDSIASGPAAPDPSTYQDAIAVMQRYKIWEKCPPRVRRILLAGKSGRLEETPKPGNKVFRRVHTSIVGSNRISCETMVHEARKKKMNPLLLSTYIEGEARHIGTLIGAVALEARSTGNPVEKPGAIVGGGETTVTVRGRGIGGRNQEVALAASTKISGTDGIAIACMATDGIDGPTDAAGAIVDGATITRIGGLERAIEFLEDNDSFRCFSMIGDLMLTGPTGTNVNDIIVAVVL
jgi:glycerate-2-kinase